MLTTITKIKDILTKYSYYQLDEESNTIIQVGSAMTNNHITAQLFNIMDDLQALNINYEINELQQIELKL